MRRRISLGRPAQPLWCAMPPVQERRRWSGRERAVRVAGAAGEVRVAYGAACGALLQPAAGLRQCPPAPSSAAPQLPAQPQGLPALLPAQAASPEEQDVSEGRPAAAACRAGRAGGRLSGAEASVNWGRCSDASAFEEEGQEGSRLTHSLRSACHSSACCAVFQPLSSGCRGAEAVQPPLPSNSPSSSSPPCSRPGREAIYDGARRRHRRWRRPARRGCPACARSCRRGGRLGRQCWWRQRRV